MKNNETLVLSLQPTGWFCDHVGNKDVQAAFGTTMLATPFGPDKSPEFVMGAIAAWNDQCSIRLA